MNYRKGGEEMHKGDFVRTIGGKALPIGTFVEIIDELADGVFLCGAADGNYIVVASNLVPIEGD